MRKILFALLIAAPSAASAQVPGYPGSPSGEAPPINLDPGSAATTAPAPRPQATPQQQQGAQQPNVVIVGPDGKVTYGPGVQQPGQPAAGAGYYYPSTEGGFGYPEQDQGSDVVYAGPTPELHVVRHGDTLWDICQMYFNDPWQWPKVWSYNPQITNPHWIYPGDLVRLLPRGMFAEQQPGTTQPETTQEPVDNLPAPAQRKNLGLKQLAFVEKSDLDKSITIDGSVDEKELLGTGDSVYLAYPSNNPPKIGQRYSIYKPGNPVKSGGKEVGSYVRLLGTLEVVSLKQDRRARGVIVEANQEIERGAKVGPLLKEFKNVAPVPSKVDAQGSIVALLRHDQLIGKGEVVFVDLGKASGVEVGNRLAVVRRGDALPKQSKQTTGQDDRRFPTRTLGEVLVVEVGENVSIGVVTLAVQEMGVGDIVMMQKQE